MLQLTSFLPAGVGLRSACRNDGGCRPIKQKTQIMEEGDAVAHACEPSSIADPARRLDRRAAAARHGFRAGGLADTDGALRQRFSGRRRHRHAVAHSLPEDERTVRTVLRGREPGQARAACWAAMRWRNRRRTVTRSALAASPPTCWRSEPTPNLPYDPRERFHLHRRHVAAAEYPLRQEGSVRSRT